MSNIQHILTFDISTSIIGVSYIKIEGTEFHIEWTRPIIFHYKADEFMKLDAFKEFLDELDVTPTNIIIEAPLKFSNNQNTVAKLQFFNGMCSSFLYFKWHIVPEYINPTKARKLAFPDTVFSQKKDKKEMVVAKVLENFPNLVLPNNISKYDCADSIVIGLAYFNTLNEK